jgi:hypothetical protein
VAEMEGLAQTPETTTPFKGALTDLFTIQLFLRQTQGEKGVHLFSNRVWDPDQYLKFLLFLLICDISGDEFEQLIDLASPLERVAIADVVPDPMEPPPPLPTVVQPNSQISGVKRGRHFDAPQRRFCSYEEEEAYENELEDIQFLLDCDARFRGISVLRSSDLLNHKETMDPLQRLR